MMDQPRRPPSCPPQPEESKATVKNNATDNKDNSGIYRVPEQRFGMGKRQDSFASDIAGGSEEKDAFRQAIADRKAKGLDIAPPESPFAQQSNEYHKSSKAASKALEEWRRRQAPGPDKVQLANDVAQAYRQEANDRQDMRTNWPGYDTYTGTKGHAKRIERVNDTADEFEDKSEYGQGW
ncbi:hypothetical protein F4813DRAFT_396869 [Daldinia decipiens]|uniref:uncharacterized protein n=1 Tax=Daldinia decipiens TaxID=326647 RepID=UPI0020C47BA1|nr:uncharacterized protein F4813DRAFT_396869 [Daldinia decipiens]KAI1662178.1 hypothetical protein F4813DRAFT_396869 [Daldinia decipiens]